MTIEIGNLKFDDIVYDQDSDVLYLRARQPESVVGERTPEGHVVLHDASGEICGVTLIGVKHLLSQGEPLGITLLQREELDPEALALALN